MSEKKVPLSNVQRIIIKFLVAEKVLPAEIYMRLHNQFGDECLSISQVYRWCKAFSEGRKKIENEPHKRRPRTSITQDNIDHVKKMILEDRRVTIREMVQEIGISVGSIETIIHDYLHYRKISARWVPKLLTFDQKFRRQEVCERLLQRYEEEGDDFLHRIFTTDETWVHHYTPESKRSSKEWRTKEEGAPVKAKVSRSAGKVMCTVFWDCKGVIFVDFLHGHKTINAQYYSDMLRKVKPIYKSKRRDIPIRRAILLQDNARPHTAQVTMDTLRKLGWETLEHAPYSPDLSPCDYHLFGPLKEALGGQRFEDNDEVETFVRNWLAAQPKDFYNTGIQKLPSRWRKCIAVKGEYLEKM